LRLNLTAGRPFNGDFVIQIRQGKEAMRQRVDKRGSMMDGLAAENTPSGPIRSVAQGSLAGLGLSALGIVFGDIGTSPLYTLKTVLALTGGAPSPCQRRRSRARSRELRSLGTVAVKPSGQSTTPCRSCGSLSLFKSL
jgi:hypothetical protein